MGFRVQAQAQAPGPASSGSGLLPASSSFNQIMRHVQQGTWPAAQSQATSFSASLINNIQTAATLEAAPRAFSFAYSCARGEMNIRHLSSRPVQYTAASNANYKCGPCSGGGVARHRRKN